MRAVGGVVAITIALEYIAFFGTSYAFAHHPKRDQVMGEVVYKWFVFRVWEFFAGASLGMIFARAGGPVPRGRVARDVVLASSIAWMVGVVVLEWRGFLPIYSHYFPAYTPAFLTLIAALASGRSFMTPWLASGPMVLLGEASFSLYLLHGPVFRLFEATYSKGSMSPWLIYPVMAGCVGLSLACYRWFELPMRDRWRAKPTLETTPHPLSEPREAISA